jgi:hypothetical protein
MNAMKSRITATVLLMALASAASGQSVDRTVQTALRGLGEGNPHAVWVALPAGYQQDIAALAHSVAARVDPAVWDRSFALGAKLVNVLKIKKQLVLASPTVTAIGYAPQQTEAAYDTAVEMFALLVGSDLATSATATQLDVGRFTQTTGAALFKRGMALCEQLGLRPAELAKLKDTSVTLVGQEQGVATLKFEVPGGSPHTESFVQVEGKWVPRSLANHWSDHIAQASTQVAAIPSPDTKQMLALLDAIDAQLNLLAKTDDPDQFNRCLGGTQLLILSLFYQFGLTPQQLDEALSAI